jgi:hypothetical protein
VLNKIINIFLAGFGLCRIVGWQNIYRSGHFHRCGKPGMFDRHPGDLYASRAAAMADVDQAAKHLYVATTRVVWYEDKQPHVNCATSVPVPLATTRRKLTEDGGEYIDGKWVPPAPPLTQEEIDWALAQANAYMHF